MGRIIVLFSAFAIVLFPLLVRAEESLKGRIAEIAVTLHQVNSADSTSNCDLAKATSAPKRPLETDVLYSWQTLPAVLEWASTGPKSQLFQNGYLYAWRTPAATFGYGDLPIRIKLREDVSFKKIALKQRNCSNFPETERESTVYLISLNEDGWGTPNTLDYLLCSPKVMASWSFGTAEGLEEIKKEYVFVSKHPEQADDYSEYDPREPDQPFGRMDLPAPYWSAEQLQLKIDFLLKLSRSDLPRVYCLNEQGACGKEHFSSKYPTYFRPRTLEKIENYSESPLHVRDVPVQTVYISDATLLRNDETLHAARILLEHKLSLKTVIVSDRSALELLSKAPIPSRDDVQAILDHSEIISPEQVEAVASHISEPTYTIGPMSLKSGGPIFDFSKLTPEGMYDRDVEWANYLVLFLLKLDQTLLANRIAEGESYEALISYLANKPLRQSVKPTSGIYYYEEAEGGCSRVPINLIGDSTQSVRKEPANEGSSTLMVGKAKGHREARFLKEVLCRQDFFERRISRHGPRKLSCKTRLIA